MGKTKRGKERTKLTAMADGSSFPLAVHSASASPHEVVTLVGETLSERSVEECPLKLVDDRTYDGSDSLDEALLNEGIEMISLRTGQHEEDQVSRDGRKLSDAMRRGVGR